MAASRLAAVRPAPAASAERRRSRRFMDGTPASGVSRRRGYRLDRPITSPNTPPVIPRRMPYTGPMAGPTEPMTVERFLQALERSALLPPAAIRAAAASAPAAARTDPQ